MPRARCQRLPRMSGMPGRTALRCWPSHRRFVLAIFCPGIKRAICCEKAEADDEPRKAEPAVAAPSSHVTPLPEQVRYMIRDTGEGGMGALCVCVCVCVPGVL